MQQFRKHLILSTSEGLIGRSLIIVLGMGSRGDAGVDQGAFR